MERTVKTVTQIIKEIDDHIRECGGSYSRWYIGITSDYRERLFNDHNVNKDRNSWIYRDCGSEAAARKVEQFFLRKGCDGGTGGGDISTTYAYAYEKKDHTNP
ncbi:MAG TPA: hypothetical protein ENH85_04905 [Candidatus Scalindua sp.]|nr:hypothetical protein [Candidatus Scalindua sp.]